MNKGFRELVGLQVTFNETEQRYSLAHYYQWTPNVLGLGPLSIRGYDMVLHDKKEDIVDGLRRAYDPVIVFVWQKTTEETDSEYLQFLLGARPDEVGLGDDWTLAGET